MNYLLNHINAKVPNEIENKTDAKTMRVKQKTLVSVVQFSHKCAVLQTVLHRISCCKIAPLIFVFWKLY